ncbi:citrate/2-methylcitrate synthase [Ottowia sp. VDI28]|uniref:citrate/2-methylcitrate synthase n=1 Tax=Ottowia sp. VDI28 TaxID=3133968 RepID=UPI003C2C34C9
MNASTTFIQAPAGLKNVIVADTEIGDVLGQQGFYHYRGRNAVSVAAHYSFEQAAYLVLHGSLPEAGSEELQDFAARLGQYRVMAPAMEALVRSLATPSANPLQVLRTVVSALGVSEGMRPMYDLPEQDRYEDVLRMAAVAPTVLAAAYRVAQGQEPIAADPLLPHATDYLRMVSGTMPNQQDARAVEQYLVTTIDHGFNASTFTARVVASTGSDVASCIGAAIGSFLGPLHGGAPDRALQALDEVGDIANTTDWVRRQIAEGRRIMGFGHAVYRTHDPRAVFLRRLAAAYEDPLVARAAALEAAIEAALAELKPGRQLYANVEFYAGVVMALAGLKPELFTPTFCVARIMGWGANVLEQARDPKIIRPSARYIGPAPEIAEGKGPVVTAL